MEKKKTKGKASSTDILVGHRLRIRRKFLNKSQDDLGQEVGLTYQQIQKYEVGTNRISAGTLKDLADALKVTPNYFYRDLEYENTDFGEQSQQNLEFLTLFEEVKDQKVRKSLVELLKGLVHTEVSK